MKNHFLRMRRIEVFLHLPSPKPPPRFAERGNKQKDDFERRAYDWADCIV
jgi:hypothetical protein